MTYIRRPSLGIEYFGHSQSRETTVRYLWLCNLRSPFTLNNLPIPHWMSKFPFCLRLRNLSILGFLEFERFFILEIVLDGKPRETDLIVLLVSLNEQVNRTLNQYTVGDWKVRDYQDVFIGCHLLPTKKVPINSEVMILFLTTYDVSFLVSTTDGPKVLDQDSEKSIVGGTEPRTWRRCTCQGTSQRLYGVL